MPIPKKDPKKMQRLEKALKRGFHSVEKLSDYSELSPRSVYRYMDELRENGVHIISKKDVTGEVLFATIQLDMF